MIQNLGLTFSEILSTSIYILTRKVVSNENTTPFPSLVQIPYNKYAARPAKKSQHLSAAAAAVKQAKRLYSRTAIKLRKSFFDLEIYIYTLKRRYPACKPQEAKYTKPKSRHQKKRRLTNHANPFLRTTTTTDPPFILMPM